MRIRKIPKGGGRFRTIYCPNAKEKRRLQALLPLLHEIHAKAVDAAGTRGIAHAFVPHRNPVTCAMPHRGFQVTVSCDLENWFDTVREEQLVAAGVPPEVAKQITIDGVCRQGLPTSPVAANIAAVAMDVDILWSLNCLKENFLEHAQCEFTFAYTRYADDIMVSFSETGEGVINHIVETIARNVGHHKWTIAEHKTHIQHAKTGRRIIVGIAVDDRVQATRKTRRKLRAARHQAQGKIYLGGKHIGGGVNPKATKSAEGLAEWAACKLPRRVRSTRQMMGVLAGSGPVAAPTEQTQTVALSGSGRRVLVPVREKLADDSANP